MQSRLAITAWIASMKQKMFSAQPVDGYFHAQSHINLGNTLINTFRPDEKVVLLERGLKLDPSSHNSCGICFGLSLLGRFDPVEIL